MSRVFDWIKADAALQRAAMAGVRGSSSDRSGQFNVDQRYIDALGERDGRIVIALMCDYLEVRTVWRVYAELFETNEETVGTLNWASSVTFGVVQQELFQAMVVRLYRFFDKNTDALSFSRLDKRNPKLTAAVKRVIADAQRAVTDGVQRYRHELVAHKSLSNVLQRGPQKPTKTLNGEHLGCAIEAVGAALSVIHECCFPGIELAWPTQDGLTVGLTHVLRAAQERELKFKRELGLFP